MLAPPVKSGPKFDDLIQAEKVRVIDENGEIVEALYGVRSKGHVEGLRETLGV